MTATFSNCNDGLYTVNGSASISVTAVQTCTEDDVAHDVPADLTGAFSGSIVIDGETMMFTNFGVVITNPVYDEGMGGTCSIIAGTVHATGTVSTEVAGETTTIDLGTSSLDVTFADQETATQVTVNGTVSVDTLCTDGAQEFALQTIEPLIVPDGDTAPSNGQLSVNGETVDFSTNPIAIPCSGLL